MYSRIFLIVSFIFLFCPAVQSAELTDVEVKKLKQSMLQLEEFKVENEKLKKLVSNLELKITILEDTTFHLENVKGLTNKIDVQKDELIVLLEEHIEDLEKVNFWQNLINKTAMYVALFVLGGLLL